MFSMAMTLALLETQVDHTRLRDGRGLLTGGPQSHKVVVILSEPGFDWIIPSVTGNSIWPEPPSDSTANLLDYVRRHLRGWLCDSSYATQVISSILVTALDPNQQGKSLTVGFYFGLNSGYYFSR